MTKTKGSTQVMGLIGGSGRTNSTMITEISSSSYYEPNNSRTEFTEEEVEVGNSSELFQRVEDEESQNIVS